MGWQVKLGGQLTISQDGRPCGVPENKTVATLLVGLLSKGPSWSSREELAAVLYPESDSAARRASLRQSLFRLRRWLGPSALEESQDRLRLAPGAWTYDFLLENGQKASAPMIAPGLIHPWIESLRHEWAPTPTAVADNRVAHFAAAVETAARIDPDTGRNLLVGGSLLTESLSVDQLGALLALTQPKDRRDPLAFEHLGLRSVLYFRLGCYKEAKATQLQAYRLASQQRRPGHMIHAGAMVLFLEIEDGQLGEAAAWVDYLQSVRNADTKSLLFCNARAAYLWNMNRLDEAVAQMNQAIRRIPSADRATRLHFWTNYSVLCAEAGLVELSRDALVEARTLAIPGLDIFRMITLNLAEASQLIALRQPDEATALLHDSRIACIERGSEPADWYAAEAMAEALAIAGRVAEAKRLWMSIEVQRLSRCTRRTPRVLARRARIMRSA